MRQSLVLAAVLGLLGVTSLSAEFRQIDLTIFGMD